MDLHPLTDKPFLFLMALLVYILTETIDWIIMFFNLPADFTFGWLIQFRS